MDTNDAMHGTLTVCVRETNDIRGQVRFEAWVDLFRVSEGYPEAGIQSDIKSKRGKTEPIEDAKPFRSGVKTRREDSCYEFSDLPAGRYYAKAKVGGISARSLEVTIDAGECRSERVICEVNTGFRVFTRIAADDCRTIECPDGVKGRAMWLVVRHRAELTAGKRRQVKFLAPFAKQMSGPREVIADRSDAELAEGAAGRLASGETIELEQMIMPSTSGVHSAIANMDLSDETGVLAGTEVGVRDEIQQVAGDISVTMRRTAPELTDDLALWVVIRNSTNALSFNNYASFLDHLFCGDKNAQQRIGQLELQARANPLARDAAFRDLAQRRFLPYTDSDAYRLLKVATEAFVMVNCGVVLREFPFTEEDARYVSRKVGLTPDLGPFWHRYLQSVNGSPNSVLPYLALVRRKLSEVSIKTRLFDDPELLPPSTFEECWGILANKLTAPCLMELIWSYWHEEGMLVQTLNAVTRRFQNVRISVPGLDPLANFEVDPLRPLNNLLWAYTQDEQHRLSVVRRNYEYDHEYGLRLEGRAVGNLRAADSRSKFLEAFHHLLHLTAQFYRQDDNTTIVADGFPVLNALKEVHLILAEGAHNQFGDLPSTARIEMLMQQWLLARPEFREFLPTRVMVAYPEPWMDRVDAMKRLQGWSDTNVLNFRNLGAFGEQLLLTIRYGNWSDVHDAAQGANWARFWRPEVQGYVHAYRAVSGVDLSQIAGDARVDATLPSTLLRRRLAAQQQQQR